MYRNCVNKKLALKGHVHVIDYKKMTAPCGLDCFNCPLFIAKNDERMRKRVSENMNIPFGECYCDGCRMERGKIRVLNFEDMCRVYKCATDKGYEFCYVCEDFPCDFLQPYADRAKQFPHNFKVYNLCLIKKLGLERWAKEKSKDVRTRYFKESFHL